MVVYTSENQGVRQSFPEIYREGWLSSRSISPSLCGVQTQIAGGSADCHQRQGK